MISRFLLPPLLAVALSSAHVSSDGDDILIKNGRLVKWINGNGGSVNARQEVRIDKFKRKASPRGVYATEDIEDGSLLCSIPWELIIKPVDDLRQCDTVRALLNELGKDSPTPYAELLKQTGTPFLPETWTEAGRALLDQVLGPSLPPRDYLKFNLWWNESCKEECSNPAGFNAALLMFTRSTEVYSLEADVPSQKVMVPL